MAARKKGRIAALLAAWGLLVAAAGQSASTPDGGAGLVPFVDKLVGFELGIPAGWNYDRAGFFGPGGSRGVLRGVAPDGLTTLQVLIFRQPEGGDFSQWTEYFGRQLAMISGIERVRIEPQPSAERPAAILEAPATLGAQRTRTLYYCVRFDERTVWVLAYATITGRGSASEAQVAADAAGALETPELFRAMHGSLRLLYDASAAQEMAEALERGRAYLARRQLQEDIRALRLDEKQRTYLLKVRGEALGYLTRRFARGSEPLEHPSPAAQPREGLRVYERIWQFEPGGGAQFTRIELFSRQDGNTDLLEFNGTRVPGPGEAATGPLATRDQVVREGDALFSSFVTSRDEGLPDPREPIKLDDTYLGLAWARALPALLGSQPAAMYAFTIYDSASRTLLTYGIRPLGRRPLPGRNQSVPAYETREGNVPDAALLYTDEYGHMLRLESGELVLELTDEATIERLFRQKRDEALRRLAGATPVPP